MKTIYKNGAVYTGKLPLVEAFAVEDGKFVFAGSSAEADALAAAGDKVVDLGGKFVCSGFNDSHMHYLHYVRAKKTAVDLYGCTSLKEVLSRMRRALEQDYDPSLGLWLTGEGWNHDYFTDEQRFPTAKELDAITTEYPMLIMRACFHIGVMNSKAMELMNINKDTVGQYGVYAENYPDGTPNGVIKEGVFDDIKARLPMPGCEQLLEMMIDCQKDLFDAVEVVLVGKEKKDRIMSKEERRIVSYHEVGHALIAALQKNAEPVQKITIVPRTMGALGYVMQVPEEEKYLNSKAELHDMIVGLLGGRAAEEIVFDTVTTGASNDIERATNIARAMVTQYGMSKRFGLMGLATTESQYLDQTTAMNCSDVTAAAVDEEVMKILKNCYKEAKKMLTENRAVMDKIAAHLIEQETITGKEFMKIYRKEKGLPEPEEKKDKKDDTEKTGFAAKLEAEAEAEKKTVEKHVTVIKAPDTDPASEMKNDTEPAPEAEKAAPEAGDAVKEPEQKQERTEDTNSES